MLCIHNATDKARLGQSPTRAPCHVWHSMGAASLTNCSGHNTHTQAAQQQDCPLWVGAHQRHTRSPLCSSLSKPLMPTPRCEGGKSDAGPEWATHEPAARAAVSVVCVGCQTLQSGRCHTQACLSNLLPGPSHSKPAVSAPRRSHSQHRGVPSEAHQGQPPTTGPAPSQRCTTASSRRSTTTWSPCFMGRLVEKM